MSSGSIEDLQLSESELRAKGYRPVTLWLRDTTVPGFAEECRRQCELIKASESEQNYLDELDLAAAEGWR
jgi:hypothetical protein